MSQEYFPSSPIARTAYIGAYAASVLTTIYLVLPDSDPQPPYMVTTLGERLTAYEQDPGYHIDTLYDGNRAEVEIGSAAMESILSVDIACREGAVITVTFNDPNTVVRQENDGACHDDKITPEDHIVQRLDLPLIVPNT